MDIVFASSVTIMPTPTLVIWPKDWQNEQAGLNQISIEQQDFTCSLCLSHEMRPFIIFCSNCDCLANFTLPAESKEGEESPFKEITFTELEREEAAKLVEKYNKVKSEM